jgi:sulfur-oxidizing protein SoxZ
MDKPRVKVPAKVKRGEPFEVKALVSHKMESGQRKDEKTGAKIPRKILHSFLCSLDGAEVFRAKFHPAVSANPYLSFYVVAEKSGEMLFEWTDDDGSVLSTTARITVE